jgi:hypothetical protein
MNNRIFILGGSAVLLIIIALVLALRSDNIPESTHVSIDATPATTSPATPSLPDGKSNIQFELFAPTEGAVIASPLDMMGRARGTWFFEASFPIELRDANGVTLATIPAQANTDWMTEEFVDWSARIAWSATSTTATSGVLIFRKDNPSGLPEHDASIEVPVLFR